MAWDYLSKKLIFNETVVTLPVLLALKLGWKQVLFLRQVCFVLMSSKRGGNVHMFLNSCSWLFDMVKDLTEKYFPFWSFRTIQRIISALEEWDFFIVRHLHSSSPNRTGWYTINNPKLEPLLSLFMDESLMANPLLPIVSVAFREVEFLFSRSSFSIFSTGYARLAEWAATICRNVILTIDLIYARANTHTIDVRSIQVRISPVCMGFAYQHGCSGGSNG